MESYRYPCWGCDLDVKHCHSCYLEKVYSEFLIVAFQYETEFN